MIRNEERAVKWLSCTRQSHWRLSCFIFRDIIIALQLSAFFRSKLALYNKSNRVLLSQAICVIGSLGNLMFKPHVSDHQTFSGNLSHDSAFDRRTLLFKWHTVPSELNNE